MTAVAASRVAPPGLIELLLELGAGENGFAGTSVFTGEITVDQYLLRCCDMPDPAKLRPGLVPQTIFWLLNDDGITVGMLRVRHYLNDNLLLRGGHLGFYIRRKDRGKGYGKEALRLALLELKRLGETRALLTVDVGNMPSIRVIEGLGGAVENTVTDPETGAPYRRYWIDL